jgi:glycosyltransferase involved in cell wall biosynthesis
MTQSALFPGTGDLQTNRYELSLFLPVYNEQDNLRPLHEKITAAMATLGRTYEVIYVDDGSSDNSYEVLREIASRDARAKIVRFRRNYGQTAAMAAGIRAASGEILIPMDADMQNDPADIANLLAKLAEGFDVVSGWRKNRQDKAITRVLPSMLANRLISWISGVSLHDYGCSLKAYRREVLADVRLYGEMHRFIPIYANWAGARVTEIPVMHHPRLHGESKYGLGRIFKVMLDLITVKFLASYATKPIYVFGGAGFVCMAFSALTGLSALYLKFVGRADFVQTPLPLLTVTLSIMGVQLVLMGLLAEIIMRTYHESQGKLTYHVRNTLNLENPEAT